VLKIALSVLTPGQLPLLKPTVSQPGSDVRIVEMRTLTVSDFLPQLVICAPQIGSGAYLYSSSTLKWVAWTAWTVLNDSYANPRSTVLGSGLLCEFAGSESSEPLYKSRYASQG
jgi:hypothetical protein